MTTSALAHNGGKRLGAVCAYLETWHLDIEEFLELVISVQPLPPSNIPNEWHTFRLDETAANDMVFSDLFDYTGQNWHLCIGVKA